MLGDKTEPKHGIVGAGVPLYETEEDRQARWMADLEAARRAGERAAAEENERWEAAFLQALGDDNPEAIREQ